MYILTVEDATGEQSLVPEIFWERQYARSYVERSDSRFCYYNIYKIDIKNNKWDIQLVDKIWNIP